MIIVLCAKQFIKFKSFLGPPEKWHICHSTNNILAYCNHDVLPWTMIIPFFFFFLKYTIKYNHLMYKLCSDCLYIISVLSMLQYVFYFFVNFFFWIPFILLSYCCFAYWIVIWSFLSGIYSAECNSRGLKVKTIFIFSIGE